MPNYTAPVEDMMFLFEKLRDNKNYNELEKYSEVNSELVKDILDEAAKINQNLILPLAIAGDENPAKLENAKVKTLQYQYIDDTSLEIIRSDIQSNASYSDTLTGKHWYWQSATDWVPRMSETGILPHGEAYIGKTLKQGNTGAISEGGIEFNWKVDNGGKIDSKQTALLQVYTSYISESLLGYQYQYQYNFDMYFSEGSSFPVKFEMNFNSEASSPGGKLYAISIDYKANSKSLSEGYTEVPSTSYKTNSNTKTGEFQYIESEKINHLEDIKEENWDLVHQGMVAVVNERRGTAYGVFPDNSPIAGKTGSSQVFSIDRSSDKEVPPELRDHGLFVGYTPLDKPEIIVSIIVENGGGGRVSAAPVAEKIFNSYIGRTTTNAD